MIDDVKTLYAQMENVLQQNNNDIGDLAVWFVENYFKNSDSLPALKDENMVFVEGNKQDADEVIDTSKKLKINKPIQRSKQQHNINQSDRVSLFAERAGVAKIIKQDKSKLGSIVKDIQGDLESDFINDEVTSNSEENYAMFEENSIPLSGGELMTMNSLFDTPSNGGLVDFNELQKLQKIEELSMTGSVGKIKRST
jgi:hypothetical protein